MKEKEEKNKRNTPSMQAKEKKKKKKKKKGHISLILKLEFNSKKTKKLAKPLEKLGIIW